MENKRIIPQWIETLQPDEIFVFGSNLSGQHGGGAAYQAYKSFSAIWGQGYGLQGSSFGIPTMHGGIAEIKPYVDSFIQFAKENPSLKFLVTEIGCGIAGFKPEEIAPLFEPAAKIQNIFLPAKFWSVLEKK